MTIDSTLELPFGVPLPPRSPRSELEQRLHVDPDSAHRFEFGIPMRDGVELAADIFLPPAAQRPAPAVVIGTPYDKSTPFEQGEPWQEAGYAAVIYDVRGRGKSEGIWHPHARDGLDGHDVVEWVATQEWCDGAVGATGISYLGWVVWSTMAEQPSHLRAAISTAPEGRWQEEIPYTYGCFWLYYAMWYSSVRRRIFDPSRRDLPKLLETLPMEAIGREIDSAGPGWQEMMDHDTLDELFRSRRWDGEYDFGVPCLQVGGWHDRECVQATIHHYEQMIASSPARDQQWLLMGPWTHGSTRHPAGEWSGVEYPGAALDMTAIHIRFFDHFLRGADNGVEQEPRVRLYDPGAKRWEVRSEWKADTCEVQFYLDADGLLAESPGAAGEDSYRYDPLQAEGVRFDVADTWEPSLDLGELEAQDGVLTWTSGALAEPLTVHGWGELELWAATDGDDTDWHVKLGDVDEAGRSLQVAWGCLRASYGEDATEPQPVPPDEVRRYPIELTPAFHTFAPGHNIRVVLASADYPWFARSMNRFGPIATQDDPRTATNTVYRGGVRPSSLKLSVEVE